MEGFFEKRLRKGQKTYREKYKPKGEEGTFRQEQKKKIESERNYESHRYGNETDAAIKNIDEMNVTK